MLARFKFCCRYPTQLVPRWQLWVSIGRSDAGVDRDRWTILSPIRVRTFAFLPQTRKEPVYPEGMQELFLAAPVISSGLPQLAHAGYTGIMKEVAELLGEMVDAGVIIDYALFGATAQMRYTEPVATLDADVLVGLPSPENLDLLSPLYAFCAKRGYLPEGESVRVGEWPLQFIPAFSPLTREAMQQAATVDFEGISLRVVRADYLAVIALSVGRAKDMARILALLESESVTREAIATLAGKHDLAYEWRRFEARFLND